MSDEKLNELTDLTDVVGLKSIKTPNVEAHLHSPMVVQRLKERIGDKPVLFSNFPVTRVSPNHCAYDRCRELEEDGCP